MEKTWYLEQGVRFWFREVCKDGLDWIWGFQALEVSVDMHCNHALVIRLHGILSTRNSEIRLMKFRNFTCPGMLDSM